MVIHRKTLVGTAEGETAPLVEIGLYRWGWSQASGRERIGGEVPAQQTRGTVGHQNHLIPQRAIEQAGVVLAGAGVEGGQAGNHPIDPIRGEDNVIGTSQSGRVLGHFGGRVQLPCLREPRQFYTLELLAVEDAAIGRLYRAGQRLIPAFVGNFGPRRGIFV